MTLHVRKDAPAPPDIVNIIWLPPFTHFSLFLSQMFIAIDNSTLGSVLKMQTSMNTLSRKQTKLHLIFLSMFHDYLINLTAQDLGILGTIFILSRENKPQVYCLMSSILQVSSQ